MTENNLIKKFNTLDSNIEADQLLKGPRNPIYLVLDNIRSAFNVGSAFRTSDAARLQEINLCGISAFPPNPKLEKTALRSTDVVPWKYYKTSLEAVTELKKQKIPVCAVELTNVSSNFWDYSFPKPVALVFGHEVTGVNEEVLQLADKHVYIPMFGRKTTINVSTALGVVIFEILRQWNKAPL